MIQKFINSFSFAGSGLRTTWREENNFRIEVVIAILVTLIMFLFDFSSLESLFCVIAITLVLASEIINTAVEDICNKIEPNQDSAIGKIKDLMGAFVLVTSLGALVVGAIIFYHHFVLLY